jgi:hypothetical protein
MKLRLICVLTAICSTLAAQEIDPARNFKADETAIYRNFLLHYPAQLSNEIGMQEITVAYEPPLGRQNQELLPSLVVPNNRPRKLPPEIMALTTEQAVTERIAAEGKLIPAAKRTPQQGPDGYVRTLLTLSDIAFDPRRVHAAFIFSASCDCLGGQGGVAVYERKNGHWKLTSILNSWEG